ncbi:hypothetical protein BB560_001975 [Smittium megazygosporum]|uniref:Uncharacterized protein n=1 Tax=Smittium megazygosporum TaxID=133381 RepID=A0A2T9ZG64_9FUNG|nr:hypothetical protein BB560_001975 [Smittium megazygosporum]
MSSQNLELDEPDCTAPFAIGGEIHDSFHECTKSISISNPQFHDAVLLSLKKIPQIADLVTNESLKASSIQLVSSITYLCVFEEYKTGLVGNFAYLDLNNYFSVLTCTLKDCMSSSLSHSLFALENITGIFSFLLLHGNKILYETKLGNTESQICLPQKRATTTSQSKTINSSSSNQRAIPKENLSKYITSLFSDPSIYIRKDAVSLLGQLYKLKIDILENKHTTFLNNNANINAKNLTKIISQCFDHLSSQILIGNPIHAFEALLETLDSEVLSENGSLVAENCMHIIIMFLVSYLEVDGIKVCSHFGDLSKFCHCKSQSLEPEKNLLFSNISVFNDILNQGLKNDSKQSANILQKEIGRISTDILLLYLKNSSSISQNHSRFMNIYKCFIKMYSVETLDTQKNENENMFTYKSSGIIEFIWTCITAKLASCIKSPLVVFELSLDQLLINYFTKLNELQSTGFNKTQLVLENIESSCAFSEPSLISPFRFEEESKDQENRDFESRSLGIPAPIPISVLSLFSAQKLLFNGLCQIFKTTMCFRSNDTFINKIINRTYLNCKENDTIVSSSLKNEYSVNYIPNREYLDLKFDCSVERKSLDKGECKTKSLEAKELEILVSGEYGNSANTNTVVDCQKKAINFVLKLFVDPIYDSFTWKHGMVTKILEFLVSPGVKRLFLNSLIENSKAKNQKKDLKPKEKGLYGVCEPAASKPLKQNKDDVSKVDIKELLLTLINNYKLGYADLRNVVSLVLTVIRLYIYDLFNGKFQQEEEFIAFLNSDLKRETRLFCDRGPDTEKIEEISSLCKRAESAIENRFVVDSDPRTKLGILEVIAEHTRFMYDFWDNEIFSLIRRNLEEVESSYEINGVSNEKNIFISDEKRNITYETTKKTNVVEAKDTKRKVFGLEENKGSKTEKRFKESIDNNKDENIDKPVYHTRVIEDRILSRKVRISKIKELISQDSMQGIYGIFSIDFIKLVVQGGLARDEDAEIRIAAIEVMGEYIKWEEIYTRKQGINFEREYLKSNEYSKEQKPREKEFVRWAFDKVKILLEKEEISVRSHVLRMLSECRATEYLFSFMGFKSGRYINQECASDMDRVKDDEDVVETDQTQIRPFDGEADMLKELMFAEDVEMRITVIQILKQMISSVMKNTSVYYYIDQEHKLIDETSECDKHAKDGNFASHGKKKVSKAASQLNGVEHIKTTRVASIERASVSLACGVCGLEHFLNIVVPLIEKLAEDNGYMRVDYETKSLVNWIIQTVFKKELGKHDVTESRFCLKQTSENCEKSEKTNIGKLIEYSEKGYVNRKDPNGFCENQRLPKAENKKIHKNKNKTLEIKHRTLEISQKLEKKLGTKLNDIANIEPRENEITSRIYDVKNEGKTYKEMEKLLNEIEKLVNKLISKESFLYSNHIDCD